MNVSRQASQVRQVELYWQMIRSGQNLDRLRRRGRDLEKHLSMIGRFPPNQVKPLVDYTLRELEHIYQQQGHITPNTPLKACL